jgi:hypothetical protein
MRYNVKVSKDQITVHEWQATLLGQPDADGRFVSGQHTSVCSGLLLGEAVESRFFSHQHRLDIIQHPTPEPLQAMWLRILLPAADERVVLGAAKQTGVVVVDLVGNCR